MEIFTANIYDENAKAKMVRLQETLNGKTLYDFEVNYGTIPGGYSYSIDANRCNKDCKGDALQMAMSLIIEM